MDSPTNSNERLTVATTASPSFYLLDVYGCIEPTVVGPFPTEEERDEAARRTRASQDEEDALFWLDVREGAPVVGAYMAGFFDSIPATTAKGGGDVPSGLGPVY